MLAPFFLPAPNPDFALTYDQGRITGIRSTRGPQANLLAEKAHLGDLELAYRDGGTWKTVETTTPNATAGPLKVQSRFETKPGKLVWWIDVQNASAKSVQLGTLALPLAMQTNFEKGPGNSVLKHSFVSGAGSFLFWMRPDSVGPYLTLTTTKGTSLEYWKQAPGKPYRVYLHSLAERDDIAAHKGSWRIPQTGKTLIPGASARYGLEFRWAKDTDGVRDLLAQSGKLDVQVAPGMTVPTDLGVDVAFRSTDPVATIQPEFPKETAIRYVTHRAGYQIYRIKFGHLGENRLAVRQQSGAVTYLEFFACQPIETLIKKRAAFLTRTQRQKPGKWFDGLLAEWAMDTQTLLGPDNYDRIKGWRIYEVTCDDPGLGKPGYLAAKNAEYPVQAEVTALDNYIQKFVWGGLQQTTDEPYPYGIYGIPDWKTLRDSPATDLTKGKAHVWRPYDYPHITLMYRSLYRVAKDHPEIKTRLAASEYLRRAYGTAVAMFTVPMKVIKWSAYETGFYNEVVIPALIQDLRDAGMRQEAAELTAHWERKVKTFVGGKVDLFGSEYAFDSTGFESTQALADYALQNAGRLGLTVSQTKRFLETQMRANLFCRGTVEPAYYYLGSDYRGGAGNAYTLSYMSAMGGASVMQYGLTHAQDPAPYLRLGAQSFLSSWALMNAGTATSNYGAWYPGKANDGGAGGGFEPAAYGETWLGQPHGRGSWYYSCEIDLGFSGALRAARTVVTDDPIFGRTVLCGTGDSKQNGYHIIPKDGIRRRLSIRSAKTKVDLELTAARYTAAIWDEKQRTLQLTLEPVTSPNATLALGQARRKLTKNQKTINVRLP